MIKHCEHKEKVNIQYSWDHPDHYDGISETLCTKCGERRGVWSNKILKPSEWEKYPKYIKI